MTQTSSQSVSIFNAVSHTASHQQTQAGGEGVRRAERAFGGRGGRSAGGEGARRAGRALGGGGGGAQRAARMPPPPSSHTQVLLALPLLGAIVEYVLQASLADAVRAGQHERVGVELQTHRARQLLLHTLQTEVDTCSNNNNNNNNNILTSSKHIPVNNKTIM